MKKALLFILPVILLLGLTACGGNAAPTGNLSDADIGFELQGQRSMLRQDSAPLLALLKQQLGEPTTDESISCLYDGYDKFFYYDGIEVRTVPINGKDLLECIVLKNDQYQTLRGAKVGMTLDQVQALYGDRSFTDGNIVTYSISADRGNVTDNRIQFEFTGDQVSTIYIYAPSTPQ